MDDLETRLKHAVTDYQSLKESCEAQVVRWERTDFARYEPEPFYFERYRFRRGYLLEPESEILSWERQYSFDEAGHVVVIREGVGVTAQYETFYVYSDTMVEAVRYSYDKAKSPLSVARQWLSEGRPVRFEFYSQRSFHTDSYQYQRDRLVSIQSSGWHSDLGPHEHTEQISYDESGQLSSIISRQPDGTSRTLYRHPKGDQTIAALSTIVEEKLTELIVQMIKAAHDMVPEAAFCLSMSLCPQPGGWLPPWVGLGLESLLKSWFENDELQSDWEYIWSPSEHLHFPKDNEAILRCDPELNEIYDLLDQEIFLSDSWDLARKLMNDVAIALMKVDWHKIIKVTPDFVVYAVEEELNDLSESLKTSAPSLMLASFKAKGIYKDYG